MLIMMVVFVICALCVFSGNVDGSIAFGKDYKSVIVEMMMLVMTRKLDLVDSERDGDEWITTPVTLKWNVISFFYF